MKTLLILTLLMASLASAKPTKKDLTDALQKDPSDSWALYNLGLMNYLDEDFGGAIKRWKALKALDPVDWQVREKLIQAYWGAGQKKVANSEIAGLRKARDSGKHRDLTEKEFFICDQFQVGKVRVFVIEYYELKGDRPIAWKFSIKLGGDYVNHFFSVGSYPSTTEGAIFRKEIGPKDRYYHLDGYWDDGSHATYTFYRNRPDYQEVRKEVKRIINGDKNPISSTTPQNQKIEQNDADQSAADEASKSEGKEKSNPESEGASQ